MRLSKVQRWDWKTPCGVCGCRFLVGGGISRTNPEKGNENNNLVRPGGLGSGVKKEQSTKRLQTGGGEGERGSQAFNRRQLLCTEKKVPVGNTRINLKKGGSILK